jgi:hypothetical protein
VETLENMTIVIGLTGVSLLWVFCIVAMLYAFWDTIGEHMLNGLSRIKGLFKKR